MAFQAALVVVGSVLAAGGRSLYRACLALGGLTGGALAGVAVAREGASSGMAGLLLALVGGAVGVAVGVVVAYLVLRAVVAAAGFAAGTVGALGVTAPGLAAASVEQPLHVVGRVLEGGVGGELVIPAAVGVVAGVAAVAVRRRFFGAAATLAGAYLVSSGITGHGVSPVRGFLPVEGFYVALVACFGLGMLFQRLLGSGLPELSLPGGEERESAAPERERVVLEAREGAGERVEFDVVGGRAPEAGPREGA